MPEVFVGRQPIFNKDLRIVAYELLFRGEPGDQAIFDDGDKATSQVIHNTFLELGLERIVGKKTAFINLTRNLLLADMPLVFPPERVVLEVLEDIVADEAVVDVVRSLGQRGYRVALDDFLWRDDLEALVPLIEIVKIDIRQLDREGLAEYAQRLKRHSLRLLAEKVETKDEFDYCLSLGFELFQGYYLSRPEVVTGQRAPSNRMAVLQLLQKANDPDADLVELERIISNDPSLSYQILRFVNSAAVGAGIRVESIHRAVLVLGTAAIRNWITMIALTGLEDRPTELLVTTLVRAQFCQALADLTDRRRRDSYFTVGLFSTLDQLVKTPMPQLLEQLPMNDELNRALLAGEGPIGEALACALAFESADGSASRSFRDVDEGKVCAAYLDAVAWGNDMRKKMGL